MQLNKRTLKIAGHRVTNMTGPPESSPARAIKRYSFLRRQLAGCPTPHLEPEHAQGAARRGRRQGPRDPAERTRYRDRRRLRTVGRQDLPRRRDGTAGYEGACGRLRASLWCRPARGGIQELAATVTSCAHPLAKSGREGWGTLNIWTYSERVGHPPNGYSKSTGCACHWDATGNSPTSSRRAADREKRPPKKAVNPPLRQRGCHGAGGVETYGKTRCRSSPGIGWWPHDRNFFRTRLRPHFDSGYAAFNGYFRA